MKKHITLLLTLLFSMFTHAQNLDVIETELQEIINQKSHELIDVNIFFKAQPDVKDIKRNMKSTFTKTEQREYVVEALMTFAKNSQSDVMSIIRAEEKSSSVTKIREHWLINVVNCNISRDLIYRLSTHPDIAAIAYNKDEFLLWNQEARDIRMSKPQDTDTRGMTQNITHVNADDVWELGYTGKDVLVGVIDTGVNIHHIDLINNLWDGGEEYPNHGYNTYENNHDVEDGFGHGTHCAGTICGDGTSGTQTGLAPDATIICVKVMDNAGYGNASSICAGMEFALEHGADVLSMSLGIPNASVSAKEMLRTACVNSLQIGVAAAVAVGNEGPLQISFPAPNNVRVPGGCPPPWIHPDQEINAGDLSCCIAVGAVDFNNLTAPFSSRGPVTWQNTFYGDYPYQPEIGLIRPDICAPGVGILSCDPYNNTYHVTMDGTSQATPCVTGVICLMLDKNPDLLPEEICRVLETTATKLDDNKNNERGSGLVNALAAIENIEGNNEEEETCEPTSELTATTIDEYSIALSWNTVATAKSYDIYRNDELVQNVTMTSYNDTELNPATDYCYTVVSVCENSSSDHSEQACAITNELILPCDTPTNLNAVVEEAIADFDYHFKVSLTWNEVENAESYIIYENNIEIDEVTTPSYIYGCDEEKTVEFAVMTKCESNESEMSQHISVEIKYTDIKEYEKQFEIYPNPVRDELIIDTDETINEITIYNIIGITVYHKNGILDNNIDIRDFNDGVYFVKIKTEKGEITKRIVKSL